MRLNKGNVKPVRHGVSSEKLDELASFGVKTYKDFTWKHILDFYSCADCGRCSDHCPANAVKRPLSPRFISITGRDFAFKPGVTTLSTPVSQVLSLRAGVCQDFAHLMIAGLRAIGLPARYCSGYVRTRPPPGQARRQGADQSHAWVGAWMGPDNGWVDLDPTNDLVVRDEHVLLSWGRDYADISPVKGILLGGGKQVLEVSVDLVAA
jgi:ferredoxin